MGWAIPVQAQQLSNFHLKLIPVTTDTLQLDTLTLVTGTVVITNPSTGERIDTATYSVNLTERTLVWKQPPPLDSVKIAYRTFALDFTKPIYRKDISTISQTEEFLLDPFSYNPSQGRGGPVIDFGNLDYNGSFSRGLSFGNSQDVSLTSNFNLQISGYVTEDIEVVAALTDNNLPVQPDGTTQQLQEFDRVFIQITKKPHRLIVGDYEIRNEPGHFMRFYKNLQGGSYSGRFQLKDSLQLRTTTSLAIAKGRFARNELNVTEGNQGPYKLTGANGETFIIILAGTERVFINGVPMERGSQNDYVIDYNLGEITFTPNMLITEDLRVIVEFEYSEQNYFRTMAYNYNEIKTPKVKFRTAFYHEQDNKNQAIQADLTDEQKRFLSEVGESSLISQYPGYRQVDYDANRVLYQLKDSTLLGTTYDTVFVYSTDPEIANYALTFTFTGQGRGNYRPAATTANGRVFEWVAPVNGEPQGSYEPYIVLVTPKLKQMTVLGLDYTPTANDLLYGEASLSNNDLNTFSDNGNNDNLGLATLAGYKRKTFLGSSSVTTFYDSVSNEFQTITQPAKWALVTHVNYEFVNHNFLPLDRFRPVEFERNWNFTQTEATQLDQHLANGDITLMRESWGNLGYGLSYLQNGDTYTGWMHRITGLFNKYGFKGDINGSFLNSEGTVQDTRFYRALGNIEKAFDKLKGWRIGGRYEHDNNKKYAPGTDSLLNSTFVWTDWRVYIASPADSVKYKARFEYIRRLEFRPLYNEDSLRLFTVSNTWQAGGDWVGNQYQRLGWKVTYRRFEDRDTTRPAQELEEYYLGRLQYNLNVLKGAINTDIVYELGAGQEQRRDYTFLPVNTGEGTYIWIDYNDNGLQESNEFEISVFPEDTMYIRVLNPTNEYDPVNVTVFTQILNLNPILLTGKRKGFVGFLGKFSTITSLQVERKVFRTADVSPFNPFLFQLNDEDLVAFIGNVRHTIFFNRTNTKFNLEYTLSDNRTKSNLTSGFENRRLQEHLVRPRIRLFGSVNLVVKYALGNRSNESELFTERNYDIRFHEIEPELTYLFKSKFRISLRYTLALDDNNYEGATEEAQSHELGIESRYSIISKSSMSVKFSYALVEYNGAANSPVEFAMLQGLKAGNNFIWGASFDRYLGKNVQLNLSYEGRKTGTADMVHIGRAQVRAIF